MSNLIKNFSPLADRARPESLSDFFGQEEILGEKSYLLDAIKSDRIPSLIFWGPPGSGKTTLSRIIANLTKSDFIRMSAVESGKKELMSILTIAREKLKIGQKTILFIDEIHRWNKAQQDALLPYVENGTIILIGATTENPSFEINSALLSRARVLVFKKLEEKDILKILEKTTGKFYPKIKIEKDIFQLIAKLSNGDARTALNTLEAAMGEKKSITAEKIKQIFQKSHLFYDKKGEEHYNIISALHKSMRGGDADAAVYYLVRMLEGGEDPLYIARRLVRFASEDVGLANNTALLLANSVFDACHKIGMPECGVILAQCVIYLSKSQKSVAAYDAYSAAQKDVLEHGNLPVPIHLRNAPTKLMKDLDYGKDYKYTPKEDSSHQTYFPEEIKNRKYLI